MIKTSYQTPELRDANDNVVQQGAFGKNTALSNSDNTGWIDYVMNDLEALHDVVGDTTPTLDGNGHVVEPANLAIGDEDGNRLKTSYLKLSGGSVTGTTNFRQNVKYQDNQDNVFGGVNVPATTATSQFLELYGGEQPATAGNPRLRLYPSGDGHFELTGFSNNGSSTYTLASDNSGNLKWRGNTLATLASPAFTGNPTATTQSTNNNSTRLATTAYVVNDLKADSFLVSDTLATSIPSGADLNDYTTAGTYISGSAAVTNSLSNCPVTGVSIKLVVLYIGYGNIGYGQQIIFAADMRIWVRNATTNGNWGGWKHLTYAENVLSLSGGTLTGNITLDGNTLQYVWKYGGTIGTNPSTSKDGYILRFTDSEGTSIGGVYKRILTSGATSVRIYNTKWADNSAEAVELLYYAGGSKVFQPISDNDIKLGDGNNRWSQVYAGTATINTSDERVKDNITEIPNEVLNAWGEVGWVQFQYKDALQEKGNNARIHCGAIAQRIKSVFESHNLDPFRYGLLCHDSWDAEATHRDEDGNVLEEAKPAGDLYSLRYEEALCMEAAYQRRRADRLEARIEALENALSLR